MRYGTVLGTSCKKSIQEKNVHKFGPQTKRSKKEETEKKNLPYFQAQSATQIVKTALEIPHWLDGN